ncbi:hypothetical protein PoB_000230800 [Plakobranchus ocellatus]|uniref:Uncharacterized protein n=1 Tax=Plakobranchus ocellatus TaxID=259542 RepID=A0AAV3Y0L1_9GAST|nr:hypothetical protein PoB_000230800 [Plakobranchus ocellatus]
MTPPLAYFLLLLVATQGETQLDQVTGNSSSGCDKSFPEQHHHDITPLLQRSTAACTEGLLSPSPFLQTPSSNFQEKCDANFTQGFDNYPATGASNGKTLSEYSALDLAEDYFCDPSSSYCPPLFSGPNNAHPVVVTRKDIILSRDVTALTLNLVLDVELGLQRRSTGVIEVPQFKR